MNGQKQKVRWNLKYEQGLPSMTEPDPFVIFAYGHFAKHWIECLLVATGVADPRGMKRVSKL